VKRWLLLAVGAALLPACASLPQKPDDSCAIFKEKPHWQRATQASYQRWGTPDYVQLAFVHQESHYVDDAKTSWNMVLGVIPWGRVSSAYGYAQALDGTWDNYKKSTQHYTAHRDNFADAVDFIGWYNHQSHQRLRLRKNDSYHLYLAYHEGQGGYARRTYRNKRWLLNVAKKVSSRAGRYRRQLRQCK